jgi:hypothetical protein
MPVGILSHEQSPSFRLAHDRAGADPLNITEPWLHSIIQAGAVRPSAGLTTLAQVLKSS